MSADTRVCGGGGLELRVAVFFWVVSPRVRKGRCWTGADKDVSCVLGIECVAVATWAVLCLSIACVGGVGVMWLSYRFCYVLGLYPAQYLASMRCRTMTTRGISLL